MKKAILSAAAALTVLSLPSYSQTNAAGKMRVADRNEQAGRYAKAKSHAVARAGAITAPDGDTYECTFDTQQSLEDFLILDLNGDGTKWKYVSDQQWTSVAYNATQQMNDWLITPLFTLEAGRKYVISFTARSSSPDYPERLSVYIGRSRDVESMTVEFVAPTMLTTGAPELFGAYFTPGESGEYCLGFHGTSDPDMNWLALDDIRVSSPDAVVLPTIPGEESIVYEDELIYSQDFSGVGGTLENPVNLVGEKNALEGLPGWRGVAAYGVGGGVLLDGFENEERELVPPAIDLKGNKLVRLDVKARCVERNPTSVEMFGGWDYLAGTIMVCSSQCPNGWRYAQLDLNNDFPNDDSEAVLSKEMEFPVGDVVMMVDDDLLSWTTTDVGEYPVDSFTGRLKSGFASKIVISGFDVYARIPSLDKPRGLAYSGYAPGHAKVSWDAVEGADNYYVTLYAAEYTGSGDLRYNLKRKDVKNVTGTSAEFDFDSSQPVFVDVIAMRGDTERSMTSDYLKIFGVTDPVLKGLSVADGAATLTWEPIEDGDYLTIYGYAGTISDDAREDFVIADMDFSGLADKPAGDDTPLTLSLDDYAYGWTAVPNIAVEDGAIVGDNYLGSWGGIYTTVSSLPMDFSEIAGDITVAMTARTNRSAMVKATINTYDESLHAVAEAAASDYANLTTTFETYTFKLPGGYDNAMIRINTGGSDKIYIRSLKVTCDVPAGKAIMLPYFDGSLDFASYPGITSANCDTYKGTFMLSGYNLQTVRNEVQDEDVISQAISNYSNRLCFENETDAVSIMPADDTCGEPRWYNLQGVSVDAPAAGGIYIRVQGDKAEKIVIN